MKPTNLVYTEHAAIVGVNGKASERIAVTLPYLSILRNDPKPPKPRRIDSRPQTFRKRLSPLTNTQIKRNAINRERQLATQVADLWRNGLTIVEIADLTGLKQSQVGKIRTQLRLPKRPSRHRSPALAKRPKAA